MMAKSHSRLIVILTLVLMLLLPLCSCTDRDKPFEDSTTLPIVTTAVTETSTTTTVEITDTGTTETKELGTNMVSTPADAALNPPRIIKKTTDAEYLDGNRNWQGIPGIECSTGGRLWSVWYSGGVGEGEYNWVLLYTSGDGGVSWSGPEIVINPSEHVRAFDPVFWTDPDDRLWVFWNQSYYHFDGRAGVWAMHTDNPGDESPDWSNPVRIANGVIMNKPIVLSDGGWLLPASVWSKSGTILNMGEETGANVYRSDDKGGSWQYLGGVKKNEYAKNYEENMVVELKDGSLRMYLRTAGGIESAISRDGGRTWSNSTDARLSKTVSRFHISRLASGNLLLVYHGKGSDGSRSHLTAALSEDDGATWPYQLLLDERSGISYPDAAEDQDGNIRIIYDRDRYGAMEILMAVVTEADIQARAVVSEGSRLKVIINNNGNKSAKLLRFKPQGAGLPQLTEMPQSPIISTGLAGSNAVSPSFSGAWSANHTGLLTPAQIADIGDISHGVSLIGVSMAESPVGAACDGIWSTTARAAWRGAYDAAGNIQRFNVNGESGRDDSIYMSLLTYNFGKKMTFEAFMFITKVSTNINDFPQAGDIYISDDGINWTLAGSWDRPALRSAAKDYVWFGKPLTDSLSGANPAGTVGFSLGGVSGQYIRFATVMGIGRNANKIGGLTYEGWARYDDKEDPAPQNFRELAVFGAEYGSEVTTSITTTTSKILSYKEAYSHVKETGFNAYTCVSVIIAALLMLRYR